jgi:hypothetical protein
MWYRGNRDLRQLRTDPNELIKARNSAEHDTPNQEPGLSSQPTIQHPTDDQTRDHRREQRESRGISEAGLAIDFLRIVFGFHWLSVRLYSSRPGRRFLEVTACNLWNLSQRRHQANEYL